MNSKDSKSLLNYYACRIYVMRACLAQRLEHRICNAMVIGSIPIVGFSLFSLFDVLHDMIDNASLKSKNMEKNVFLFWQKPLIYYVIGISNYLTKRILFFFYI